MEYNEVIEKVRDQYADKVIAKLYDFKEACELRQLICCDPQDMSGDEYGWIMSVYYNDDDNDGASIEIKVLEERGYDGGTGFGINFEVVITSTEAVCLGGVTPFNYSDECWVDARDYAAVAERWEFVEKLDTFPAVNLIMEA